MIIPLKIILVLLNSIIMLHTVKRNDPNVKWKDYINKQNDYNAKRKDYNVKRNDYNVKRCAAEAIFCCPTENSHHLKT